MRPAILIDLSAAGNLLLQVGVCSGLVLGFMAGLVVLQFFMSRRSSSLLSKASGQLSGAFSAAYQSPSAFPSQKIDDHADPALSAACMFLWCCA